MNMFCLLAGIEIVALNLVTPLCEGKVFAKGLNTMASVENGSTVPVVRKRQQREEREAGYPAESPAKQNDAAASAAVSKAEEKRHDAADQNFGFLLLFIHTLRGQK
jgi:hypothetical protein